MKNLDNLGLETVKRLANLGVETDVSQCGPGKRHHVRLSSPGNRQHASQSEPGNRQNRLACDSVKDPGNAIFGDSGAISEETTTTSGFQIIRTCVPGAVAVVPPLGLLVRSGLFQDEVNREGEKFNGV